MTALAIKMKKIHKEQNRQVCGFTTKFLIFLILALLAPIIVTSRSVYAEETDTEVEETTSASYSSWIQSDPTTQEMYAGTTDVGYKELELVSQDWDFSSLTWITDIWSGGVMYLGWLIDAALSGGWGVTGKVNLSTDAIIFGRLKEGVNTNWVYFELVPNNIYGILGSTYYRYLTNVVYSVFLIVFIVCLIRQACSSGESSKKQAEFKDMLQYSALMFLFLYLFPHMVDICIYLKDWLLLGIYELFGKPDEEGIGGIARTWANLWFNGSGEGGTAAGTFGAWYAFLYLGTVCAGLFFVIDYVKTAAKQTFLFGLSPVFFVLSIKNRKLLSNLFVEIFPNIFIPVFDAMLIMLPLGTARIAMSIGATGVGGLAGALGLIILIMIWSIIPMRREVLRMFGAAGIMGGQRGLGGILAAAMMGMRMFGGRIGGGFGGGAGAGIEGSAEANAELGKMYGEMSDALHGGDIGASMLRNGSTGMEGIAEDVVGGVGDIGEAGTELADLNATDLANDIENSVNGGGIPDEGLFGDSMAETSMPFGGADMEDVSNISPSMEGFNGDSDLIAARGANLESLEQLEGRQSELMGQSVALQSEIGALEAANRFDEGVLHDYERAAINPGSTGNGRYLEDSGRGEKMDKIRGDIADRRVEIAAKELELQKTNMELSQVHKGIQDARGLENYYAKSSKHTGASGETYGSSAEYKKAQQLRDIKMKYANYKNFESNHFRDVLTPEEKMRFYTERAARLNAERGIRVASTVAGVAVGGVVAAGAMYGGPSAMATGGIMAGMGTSAAGNAAGRRILDSRDMRATTTTTAPPPKQQTTTARPKPKPVEENSVRRATNYYKENLRNGRRM